MDLCPRFFCNSDESKSGLARDFGDRLQFRNMPIGTSGDWYGKNYHYISKKENVRMKYKKFPWRNLQKVEYETCLVKGINYAKSRKIVS